MTWELQAACRGQDCEDFFPETSDLRNPAVRRAKQTCLKCPVRFECLADGILRREPFGIRGGTLPNERKNQLDVFGLLRKMDHQADELRLRRVA
jgi:WhiB family transcriptional regulator, redox-sensing transcriptional regulator